MVWPSRRDREPEIGMSKEEPVRLAVVGAGAIGSIHAARIIASQHAELAVLGDTDPEAGRLASQLGVSFVSDHRDVLHHDVDGVVIATPNDQHVPIGGFFLERGVPVLVEKPIADTVIAGQRLCETASRAGVPLLVGHHRRHNSLVRKAKELIFHEIGALLGLVTMVALRKPDSYYDLPWRRTASAGPLLVNLIHEIDMIRFMCDEIVAVQASADRLNRTWDFDDTASAVLHLRDGALGTVFISESTPSPWSWENSVSEGMGFHDAGQDYARFMGTEASLSFPSLTIWSYDRSAGEPGWHQPMDIRRVTATNGDSYLAQIENFADVIEGRAEPVVTGEDGLRSLAVVEAMITAARTGSRTEVDKLLGPAT